MQKRSSERWWIGNPVLSFNIRYFYKENPFQKQIERDFNFKIIFIHVIIKYF